MANLMFYKCDVTQVIYTATYTNPDYPLSNLNSFFSADRWRSANSDNGQTLNLNLPLAGKTFVIIDGSNIQVMINNPSAIVRLQSAVKADFSLGLITIKTWIFGDTFLPLINFAALNNQYWRILYEDTGGVVPEVGNFTIGSTIDLGIHHAYPYIGGKKTYESTNESSTLDGKIRTSNIYGGRQWWKLPLKNISSVMAATFSSFFESVSGPMMPFYFTDVNWNLFLVKFDMDEDPMIAINAGDISEGEIILKRIEV